MAEFKYYWFIHRCKCKCFFKMKGVIAVFFFCCVQTVEMWPPGITRRKNPSLLSPMIIVSLCGLFSWTIHCWMCKGMLTLEKSDVQINSKLPHHGLYMWSVWTVCVICQRWLPTLLAMRPKYSDKTLSCKLMPWLLALPRHLKQPYYL